MAILRLATATRNALAQQVQVLLDAGAGAATLKIYSGTQPATPNDAITGTLLATVTLGDPSFGAAASGTITGADPAAVTAVATGAATHFRAADSTGAAVLDGDVTATGGGGALQISSTSLSPGVTVDITALSFTMPLG